MIDDKYGVKDAYMDAWRRGAIGTSISVPVSYVQREEWGFRHQEAWNMGYSDGYEAVSLARTMAGMWE